MRTISRRIRDRAELVAARGVPALLDYLPPDRLRDLARVFARTYLAVGSRRVRWARLNLEIAFPGWTDVDRTAVAIESATNVLCNLIDLRRSERWTREELLRRFSFQGLHHLDTALSAGRGVLLLSLHMGAYDLGLRALSLRLPDIRLGTISKPLTSRFLQEWLHERRNGEGVEMIAPGPSAALRALRVLRSGRPLIVLNDLYVRAGRRVDVPFFGTRCLTSTGPAVLARHGPASILPCYVVRDGVDHHTLSILPELELPDGADDEALTSVCNSALEGIIRKHPEHWTWAHRRFRYSPDLPANTYRHSSALSGRA